MSSPVQSVVAEFLQQLVPVEGSHSTSQAQQFSTSCQHSADLLSLTIQHAELATAAKRCGDDDVLRGVASAHCAQAHTDALRATTKSLSEINSSQNTVHARLQTKLAHHALPVDRRKQPYFQAALAAAATASQRNTSATTAGWASSCSEPPSCWGNMLYSRIDTVDKLRAYQTLMEEHRSQVQEFSARFGGGSGVGDVLRSSC